MAKNFWVQYKHMTDTAPDRMSLQNMEKKASESFREYAHKWRDLAAQVQPPMMDKEWTRCSWTPLRHHIMIEWSRQGWNREITKGEPTIPRTYQNQTMIISLITNIVGMSRMEITNRTPDQWRDSSPRCLRQHKWWLLNQWDSQVATPKIQEGQNLNENGSNLTQF